MMRQAHKITAEAIDSVFKLSALYTKFRDIRISWWAGSVVGMAFRAHSLLPAGDDATTLARGIESIASSRSIPEATKETR